MADPASPLGPLAPQAPFMQLDSVLGDEANMGKLWRMAQDLKEMDASWHEDHSPPPTTVEQSLYMLILGHVNSDIFLFHREKNLGMLDPPEDEVEPIVKELSDMSSALGKTLAGRKLIINYEEQDENGPCSVDASDKFFYSLDQPDLLIELLEECRGSLSKTDVHRGSVPVKSEVVESIDIEIDGCEADAMRIKEHKDATLMIPAAKDCVVKAFAGGEPLDRKSGVKTREETLQDILQGLEERRRVRAYAPPVGDELKCYREIRKWVTLTKSYINAKATWLESWSRPECGNYFAEELSHMCNGNWMSIISDGPSPADASVFWAPAGHKIAVVFDELPEFRLLLSSCKKKLSDITSTIYTKGELMDVVKCMDDIDGEIGDGKITLLPQEWEVKKKRKHDFSTVDAAGMAGENGKAAAGNDKSVTKTRVEYLVDIFWAFVKIESSYLGYRLTSREVRLYAHIVEHVSSSMWLFHNMGTPEEKHKFGVYQGMTHEERLGKKGHDPFLSGVQMGHNISLSIADITTSDPREGTKERKTREQYLQEIVCFVEAIKSSFFCSTPTAQEMILYDRISGHINVDLMQWRSCQKQEVEGNAGRGTSERALSAEEMGLARHMLMAIYEMEMELAGELEKEYEDMLHMIFPSLPQESGSFTWLEEHRQEAVSELKNLVMESPKGLEYLERTLLTLQEVNYLSVAFVLKFVRANEDTDFSMNNQKNYRVPLKEAWSALRVCSYRKLQFES